MLPTKQEIKNIRDRVDDLLADYRSITRSIQEAIIKKVECGQYNLDAQEARIIIQAAAEATQKKLEKQFSSLVTLAIQSVFQDNREFVIEFVKRRGQTEVECWIDKDGEKIGLYEGGGGLADVAAIGCTVAMHKLAKNTRPIFFLDEKFKFLHSPTLQKNLSDVLRLIANKLKLQFILVTDQANIEGDREYGVIDGEVYNVTPTESVCPKCEKTTLHSYVKGDREIFRCKECDYLDE